MNINIIFRKGEEEVIMQLSDNMMFAEAALKYLSKTGIDYEKDKPKFYFNSKELEVNSYKNLAELGFRDFFTVNVVLEKDKYISENDKYKKQLNDEILKNQRLEDENKKLKEILNEVKQSKTNEINKLTKVLEIYKKENEQLKAELLKISKNQTDNNELKKLQSEISTLKYKLTLKDNEINDLKTKSINNQREEQSFKYKDIIVINFISMDSTVHFGVKCLPTDIFAEVEEKLYKKYDNLRNTNNMFTANAKPVLRFKTINENNIKDGDIIQLIKLE